MSVSVVTTGNVTRAELYLGSGSPTAPPPVTYTLIASAPGDWTGTGSAPSQPGQYHYTVGIYGRSGKRIVADNDAWNVTVGQASGGGTAQPLPADVPLAPPFSYGNPEPAVFSAAGKTVSGSEVVSTTRPDVAPSVVAQFYLQRLPRAGWSVPQGAPPAAATSFTISGTKGSSPSERVCVVEYSGYTLHIFYGTIPG